MSADLTDAVLDMKAFHCLRTTWHDNQHACTGCRTSLWTCNPAGFHVTCFEQRVQWSLLQSSQCSEYVVPHDYLIYYRSIGFVYNLSLIHI